MKHETTDEHARTPLERLKEAQEARRILREEAAYIKGIARRLKGVGLDMLYEELSVVAENITHAEKIISDMEGEEIADSVVRAEELSRTVISLALQGNRGER